MADPVIIAIIAGASAIVGGIIAALAKPWGEDWVARRAEKRASVGAEGGRRKAQIERVGHILAGASVTGSPKSTGERELRELPTAAMAVSDPELTAAVEVLIATDRYQPSWEAARLRAAKRVGELLASL